MKENTHPNYKEINVTCSCGNKFTTRSTLGKEVLHLDICSNCHPFYTGKQKLVDTAGRVDRFKKKYANQKVVQEKVAEKIAAEKTEKEVQLTAKSKTSKAKSSSTSATGAKSKAKTSRKESAAE